MNTGIQALLAAQHMQSSVPEVVPSLVFFLEDVAINVNIPGFLVLFSRVTERDTHASDHSIPIEFSSPVFVELLLTEFSRIDKNRYMHIIEAHTFCRDLLEISDVRDHKQSVRVVVIEFDVGMFDVFTNIFQPRIVQRVASGVELQHTLAWLFSNTRYLSLLLRRPGLGWRRRINSFFIGKLSLLSILILTSASPV